MPALQRCETVLIEPGELLILAGGFEDRAFALGRHVTGSENNSAVVVEYGPFDDRNRAEEIASELSSAGLCVARDVIFHRFEPAAFTRELENLLVTYDAHKVLVDISAMSKLLILLTLNVCMKRNVQLRVFYAEAEQYNPSEEEYESAKRKNHLHQPSTAVYTGVRGVLRVDELSSVAMQGQPTAAIAFMSFNEVLTQALLDAVYPSRLLLINGVRPDRLGWRERATAWIHEQLRQEWSGDNPLVDHGLVPARRSSTIDYRETAQLLSDLYWELAADHRILLAPTGSKMQTLGCFLAKAIHPDIHIEYPTPQSFFPLYSERVSNIWLVDFGEFKSFLEGVGQVDRIQHLAVPDVSYG